MSWDQIKNELLTTIDQNGAHWLRLLFHDCFIFHKEFSIRGGPLGAGGASVQFLTAGASSQLIIDLPQNGGLAGPIKMLQGFRDRFRVSLADLIVFAAKVAIEKFGGPVVPFTPGRTDHTKEDVEALVNFFKTKYGDLFIHFLLPKPNHPDKIERMYREKFGFTLKDFTILNGAHTLGGTTFPDGKRRTWNTVPNNFSNAYYRNLVGFPWQTTISAGEGKLVWLDGPNQSLLLLETDFCLFMDIRGAMGSQFSTLNTLCREYANNQAKFFTDWVDVFGRLTTAGWNLNKPTTTKIPFLWADKGTQFLIKSALPGNHYAHVLGGNAGNAAKLALWEPVNQNNLKWTLSTAPGGFYINTVVDQSFVVHQNGISQDNNAECSLWDKRTNGQQGNLIVNFEQTKDGFWLIRFLHSNKCLHVPGANTANGTVLTQWEFVDQANLKWQLIPCDLDPFFINVGQSITVSLLSWKGDFLHRPDSPQGVTSWNTGIGNKWTLTNIGNGKFSLLSWKGDFLHRPDSPQGITSWNTGIGNEWTIEVGPNGKYQFKSWKGDFLHRPDSPQGVTTWNTGIGNEWSIVRFEE